MEGRVSEVLNTLTAKGVCRKLVVVEREGGCTLAYCDRKVPVLVAVGEQGGWLHAKIIAEQLVKPHMWHCSDVLFTPYGLYAFAEDAEELAEKIQGKLQLARAQSLIAIDRLFSAGDEG
ncbi:MAG: hypothetical protein ABWW70_03650 [Thermoproteota archaeon]